MLADPCTSTLVPGIYGTDEGLLARLKGEYTVDSASNVKNGYILWLADSSGVGTDAVNYSPCSIFGYGATNPTTRPLNTVASPLGTQALGTIGGSGYAIADPAAVLLDGGVAKDARTISACMRMIYTGTMSGAAGQVAVIENLPVESLGSLLNVDDLFRMSTSVSRIGVGTHEVKYRPGDTASHFRALSTSDTVSDPDAVIETGIPATAATTISSHGQGLRVFGFAYRDIGTDSGMAFEFIKNIEWRPAFDSGLPIKRPQTLHASPPSHVAEAALDRSTGGAWSFGHLVNEAGHVASQALSGAGHAFYDAGKAAVTGYATKAAMEFMAEAPLLLL